MGLSPGYEHYPNPSRFDANGCRQGTDVYGRILNGEQAKDVGLVTQVADDPFAAAMELAEEIAGKSPDAVRAGKTLYEQAWHADARTAGA